MGFSRTYRTNYVDFLYSPLVKCAHPLLCQKLSIFCKMDGEIQIKFFNMKHTHHGIHSILSNGVFSVRRTSKNVFRNTVEITLEQTINEDAASCSTGIVYFGGSESQQKVDDHQVWEEFITW